jgi:ASC-1-like (ASCH) protein
MIPFLLPVWGFLKGISPRTWIIIAVCVVGLYGVKKYGDHKFSQGKIEMSKIIEEQKKEEWDAKEEELKKVEADLQSQKDALTLEREAISNERTKMYSVLADNIREIRNERLRGYETAATVPGDRIWNDIRVVSRQLSTDSR